jgi:hypothetical protein
VPTSRRSILDLLELICSNKPVEGITEEVFMNEKGIYEIIQASLPDLLFIKTCNIFNII